MEDIRVDVVNLAEFLQYLKDAGESGRNTKEIREKYPNDAKFLVLHYCNGGYLESEMDPNLKTTFPGKPYEWRGDRWGVYPRFRITPKGEGLLQQMKDGVVNNLWSYSEIELDRIPPSVKIDIPEAEKPRARNPKNLEYEYGLPDWFFENP